MHHQSGPVRVTVKGKMRTAGPLIMDSQMYFFLVLLIEGVPCINEEELQVLLLGVLCS